MKSTMAIKSYIVKYSYIPKLKLKCMCVIICVYIVILYP